jgi:hypothetical protein
LAADDHAGGNDIGQTPLMSFGLHAEPYSLELIEDLYDRETPHAQDCETPTRRSRVPYVLNQDKGSIIG